MRFNRAGIKVFVTGGIGGVHKQVEESWDVSADLVELGRTPVAVVCAGAKSILDLPKTVEVLETYGVPTIGYQTSEFPAFFTAKSGLATSCRKESAAEVATVINNHINKLKIPTGLVIGAPIPSSIEGGDTDFTAAIDTACNEATRLKIGGRELTPFLLKRVNELTGGKSLEANLRLIENNARIGSQIAVELAKLD